MPLAQHYGRVDARLALAPRAVMPCAGQLSLAEIECMNALMPISVGGLADYTNVMAGFGSIDAPGNMSHAR